MSRERFDDECQDCGPVLLNPTTGQLADDDSPEMLAVMEVWAKTSREEREAFHRCTCLNSRASADLALVTALVDRFGAAVKALTGHSVPRMEV